ncbi:MAG: Spy/CpxP family protein refolding chaperone [Terracidiphilus sp.]
MKTRWGMTAGVCALGVALVASAAALQDRDGWMQRRVQDQFIHRIEMELGLTETQRAQIKTILQTEKPAILALAEQARQERQQLESRQTFDEAYVRTFAQQHESTAEEAIVEREKVRFEIWQVLTPQQRQKAEQIREGLRARFFERLTTVGDQL